MGKTKKNSFDGILFATVVILSLFGLVMIFSASAPSAFSYHNDSFYFVKKQLIWTVIGFGVLFFCASFDYKKYITLCEKVQIPLKKIMKKLSTGMKIKVQLAFAMARDAKLYVFDEPSAGLDPVFRRELMDYFFEIVADGSKSILLSTHLTDELDRIADYILYVEDGKQRFFMEKEEMLLQYRLIRGTKNQVQYYGRRMVAMQEGEMSCEALVLNNGEEFRVPVQVEKPTIEKVMYYFMQEKKEGKKNV